MRKGVEMNKDFIKEMIEIEKSLRTDLIKQLNSEQYHFGMSAVSYGIKDKIKNCDKNIKNFTAMLAN